MTDSPQTPHEFPGFPDFRANITFSPLQYFTAVIPHRSRACVRIVGYMLRRILGHVDVYGNPRETQVRFTYRELMKFAAVSRDSIAAALAEAVKYKLIDCLRAGHAKRAGENAQSAVYALRWSNHYTNRPDELDGFFSGEAVTESDQDGCRARSARKNIPDAFFDYLLRRERLSVIRVVGAMLFRSIQWGEGGERKVPVQMSISELCRLTHMTRRHVHEAVTEALERGYLVRVQEGRFDPAAGTTSHAATYAIRWTRQAVAPVYASITTPTPEASVRKGIRKKSQRGNGTSVRNGARDQSEMGNVERSEKGNGISINKSINTSSALTGVPADPSPSEAGPSAPATGAAAAGEELVKALVTVGFDSTIAANFVRDFSPDVIRRQLEWFPLRRARRNPLGLLRRAIEQDWPKPESRGITPAAIFVTNFHAAVRGLAKPMFAPNGHGAEDAESILSQLVNGTVDDSVAAEWGRRFGQFVARKHPGKTSFVWCARECGPDFVRMVRANQKRACQEAAAKAAAAERDRQHSAYDGFLVETLRRYQRDMPDLYEEFEAAQNLLMDKLGLGHHARQAMKSELGQASAFAEFARARGERVPSIEEWLRTAGTDSTGLLP